MIEEIQFGVNSILRITCIFGQFINLPNILSFVAKTKLGEGLPSTLIHYILAAITFEFSFL